MRPLSFDVYVHERGKRPRMIGATVTHKLPATWQDGDRTLYLTTADLTAGTLTFTDVRPEPVAS